MYSPDRVRIRLGVNSYLLLSDEMKPLSPKMISHIIIPVGVILCTAMGVLGWFHQQLAILFLVILFLILSLVFYLFVRFSSIQTHKLIEGTKHLASGEYEALKDIHIEGDLSHLAASIDRMGREMSDKEIKLNKQRDEYQRLYELVPCTITIQDRDFKLIGYNPEFSKRFNPVSGDYCYSAYKGRTEKCDFCPVEKTFEDGRSHYSEETGINKDGTLSHWIVKTAPLRNDEGDIIGAMEMSLDITDKKELEGQLRQSEKKYQAIFNNIPNPVFLLDRSTLEILDCNQRVNTMYGYTEDELITTSFIDLFETEEKDRIETKMRTSKEVLNTKQIHKRGETFFANIWISPSEFQSREVLLVSTLDVTKRLEAELQLIQASKMATLGEMATGVAHELNQPLTVIKTVSSFFMKKVRKKEPISDDILKTLAEEMDNHVDRASQIINHMRQFGRKSDTTMVMVQINDVLKDAFNIFSQQFKLREIDVVWDLENDLPTILAEPIRLEQVFINLLTNARDAIDMKWQSEKPGDEDEKTINLHTYSNDEGVFFEICDAGIGISEAHLNKIFEPFFTTKKIGEGTGIGLSISYGIIQAFHGSIQALSEPGEGTCFIVRFPQGEAT